MLPWKLVSHYSTLTLMSTRVPSDARRIDSWSFCSFLYIYIYYIYVCMYVSYGPNQPLPLSTTSGAYFAQGLQSEFHQRCENMCAKLLKMFLAAYPVSEHSYFSCRTTGRMAGCLYGRAGPKAEVLSLHRWLAKIFSNKFFKSLAKPSSHRHPCPSFSHLVLSTGIPGEGQAAFHHRHLSQKKKKWECGRRICMESCTFLCRLSAERTLSGHLANFPAVPTPSYLGKAYAALFHLGRVKKNELIRHNFV